MSRIIGQQYEQIALDYLSQQGLQFLERNYRCRFGEIDLIFRQAETLIFIEVKYRQNRALTDPLESIDAYKQRRLMLTAEQYLQRRCLSDHINARFDLILIQSQKNSLKDLSIDWMQNVVMGGD